ncbi:YkgJ family cysteine cluster protein [Acidiferrobacter sp.]|uniref:YkgJ family cysteine cluster protein n=1 Tax=Acidiferrobacter sp. TaxID=1872107 RepID=UPI002623AD58|nr:YkgJ family cysteine cluster protein [Acidiferrobacter sp.]
MSQDLCDARSQSPITPVQLGLDDSFQFACHRGIACFNKCCESIDIQLTPYDILRLKTRLQLSAREFLFRHTVPFEMDAHGVPGLKLRTAEESTRCQFLTDQGCGVYEDRPTACRYYALGLMSMRKKDSPVDEDAYFIVKEDHCLGHHEPHTQTVRAYRESQGVDLYDDMNRQWRQVILKKRSCGPTIGKPSDRSLQLFFLASYDLDGFRDFIAAPSFDEVYEVAPQEREQLMRDDVALMHFAFRFLKQSLFGENTIPERPGAVEKRLARRSQRTAEGASETAG